MSDYLRVVYSEENIPYTDYPEKLCHYLFKIFQMSPGMTFLEMGCGRGEFLKNFAGLKLDAHGVDLSPESPKYNPDISIKICDIEKDELPYPDDLFDVIFSKSFLEHLYYPERFMKEAYRCLKPGGLLLSLVPDWEVQYKNYFDDYTHRTPFTKIALDDIYNIFGFEEVEVFKFRQLPIVWRYPMLNYVCAMISPLIPIRTEIKLLKWSKLLMLVGSGRKPTV